MAVGDGVSGRRVRRRGKRVVVVRKGRGEMLREGEGLKRGFVVANRKASIVKLSWRVLGW